MRELTQGEFFAAVVPPLMRNEFAEVRLLDRTDGSVTRQFFPSVQQMLAFLDSGAVGSRDAYYGVATRFGRSGRKRDCNRVTCAWMDWDGTALSDVDALDPAPSIVVESGSGLHCYWLFTTPLFVRAERWLDLEGINRAFALRFGGDIAAIDTSRILRIPGTFNRKHAQPKLVRAYETV